MHITTRLITNFSEKLQNDSFREMCLLGDDGYLSLKNETNIVLHLFLLTFESSWPNLQAEIYCGGAKQHLSSVRKCEGQRLWGSKSEGKPWWTVLTLGNRAPWWWSNDDSFYVRPSLMSNGPIITGECKQEKTLHTDMGLVLEQVFVVVWKTAGSCVSVPSLVAVLFFSFPVASPSVDSKWITAHDRRCPCKPCKNL